MPWGLAAGTWIGNDRAWARKNPLKDGRTTSSQHLSIVKTNYTTEELAGMTMVDVGCYDGFLSVEIEKRLKFKENDGVEPREKNISKGRMARQFCGIGPQVEFTIGDIASLASSGQTFDIVFCSGVFHHLEYRLGGKILEKDLCQIHL